MLLFKLYTRGKLRRTYLYISLLILIVLSPVYMEEVFEKSFPAAPTKDLAQIERWLKTAGIYFDSYESAAITAVGHSSNSILVHSRFKSPLPGECLDLLTSLRKEPSASMAQTLSKCWNSEGEVYLWNVQENGFPLLERKLHLTSYFSLGWSFYGVSHFLLLAIFFELLLLFELVFLIVRRGYVSGFGFVVGIFLLVPISFTFNMVLYVFVRFQRYNTSFVWPAIVESSDILSTAFKASLILAVCSVFILLIRWSVPRFSSFRTDRIVSGFLAFALLVSILFVCRLALYTSPLTSLTDSDIKQIVECLQKAESEETYEAVSQIVARKIGLPLENVGLIVKRLDGKIWLDDRGKGDLNMPIGSVLEVPSSCPIVTESVATNTRWFSSWLASLSGAAWMVAPLTTQEQTSVVILGVEVQKSLLDKLLLYVADQPARSLELEEDMCLYKVVYSPR